MKSVSNTVRTVIAVRKKSLLLLPKALAQIQRPCHIELFQQYLTVSSCQPSLNFKEFHLKKAGSISNLARFI